MHVHAHDRRSGSRRALSWVLGLTLAFTAVEVAGGIWTDSLALLADAGHMLSDNVALGLALLAVTLARRPSTPRRSFGLQRAEILAAFVNGLTLVLVSGWIVWEAVNRFGDTPEILGGWMLAVAVAGLAVNALSAWILVRSGRESLNVEAAFRHVVADVLGSGAVFVAAVIVVTTGWTLVDPLVSLGIALLIVASAWGVLRDSTSILMEATPTEIEVAVGLGLSVLKLFPIKQLGGVEYLSALAGPFGDVRFVPSGGIGPDALGDYFSRANVLAIGGSWIAPRSAIDHGDFAGIEARANRAVAKVRAVRAKVVEGSEL